MRSFLKGILAGTLLGALAGSFMKPSRKPELRDLMHMADGTEIKKKTGKVIKGVVRSMDKMMKK
ncbi:MAG: hypothetical protein ACOY40_09445 [Bacillota bacterium]